MGDLPFKRSRSTSTLNELLNLLAAAYVAGQPAADAGDDPFDFLADRRDRLTESRASHHADSALLSS